MGPGSEVPVPLDLTLSKGLQSLLKKAWPSVHTVDCKVGAETLKHNIGPQKQFLMECIEGL